MSESEVIKQRQSSVTSSAVNVGPNRSRRSSWSDSKVQLIEWKLLLDYFSPVCRKFGISVMTQKTTPTLAH
jgi:hypothetical protein